MIRSSIATNSFSWFSTGPSTDAAQQSQTQEETINVPKSMVRFLIGIKGRNLAALAERSGGAKILFTKQETPQGEEIAKIIGDSNQIAQMRELIKEDLEKLKNDPNVSTAQHAKHDDDYMEEVIVDSQYVGFLIGKQGTILKEMENSTGAKIQYSARDDSAQERTARIRGTPSQVQAAKKMISDKIYSTADEMRSGKRFDGADRRGGNRQQQGGRGPRSRDPSPTDVKQVVEVPSECVGPLIGKGGKSLFQMQDQTGAKFNFAKDDHREGAREVTIFGSEDQIKSACDLIQQRVRQVLERNEAGGQ
jgi:far upstream element-binding protein